MTESTKTDTNKGCCLPTRDASDNPTQELQEFSPAGLKLRTVAVAGGRAMIGTSQPQIKVDQEGPCRSRKVKPFHIMPTTVTNGMFETFIKETGFVTEAERFGWSFVFVSQVPDSIPMSQAVAGVPWWRRIDGADWRHISGPGTQDAWHPDHPVVQVSWHDAQAFAHWAGGRLPTELEWEHAARGGLKDVPFPWGEQEPDDTKFHPCNIWQGEFPNSNTKADGFETTAPAQSFGPNGFGLYNMVGNVWEWTAEPFTVRSSTKEAQALAAQNDGMKLLKGGSFLCHKSYCFRYRIAARTGNAPDTGTPHQGFRLAFDISNV